MIFEQTPSLGQEIIKRTPNHSPMASASIIHDSEIMGQIDFSGLTTPGDSQKMLRVRPYQIFNRIEENAFSVELTTPDNLNGLLSKTSGLEDMYVYSGGDIAPNPNPQVKFKVLSDRTPKALVLNERDIGKVHSFLGEHLGGADLPLRISSSLN